MELNTVIHGDCLEVMKSIPDKSIDLILTDPPYLHIKGGMNSKLSNKICYKNNVLFKDSFTHTKMSDFGEKQIFNFLNIVEKKQKQINMIIFCSELQLQYYFKWISTKKLKYNLLIWNKEKKFIINRNRYIPEFEYIIRIYGRISIFNSLPDNELYLKIKNYKRDGNVHETQKPIELIKSFVLLHSKENDVILDCFAGSGTTAIACLKTNRNYILIEKEAKYIEVINKRIEDYTNQLKIF